MWLVGGHRPFHDLSVGETAVPPIGREMRSPAYTSGTQISLRKDQAGSLGTEEKTSWPSYTHFGYVKCKQ